MPGRYTTKTRAKRIELHYFKRLYPFRRWKLILTIAVPVVAAGWLIAMAALGDQRAYNTGPVSTAHAMFDVQCEQCHVPARAAGAAAPSGSAFWLRVPDPACLKCHDGTVHHATQVDTPTCASCHLEHKGRVALATMNDAHCTRCHRDLRTRDGSATDYRRRIERFPAPGRGGAGETDHPEFAVSVKEDGRRARVHVTDKARLADTAQMKLNHQVHLKPGLKGIDEVTAQRGAKGLASSPKGMQLTCTFCHEPDQASAYMRPVTYARHCADCHPLGYDAERFPGGVVPHDRPLIVRAFLRSQYAEAPEGDKRAAAQKPEAREPEPDQPRRRLGAREEPEEEQPRAGRLAGRRDAPEEPQEERPRAGRLGGRRDAPEETGPKGLQQAQAYLFQNKQGCKLCHTLTPGEKLPEVAPTCMPARWLPHSRFDHGAHRSLSCAECHKAAQSTETKDVLLPSIATCRECHHGRAGGARTGCVECHVYHDPDTARDLNGPFTIRELVTGAPGRPQAAPAAAKRAPGPC
jgi:hypothetical protein